MNAIIQLPASPHFGVNPNIFFASRYQVFLCFYALAILIRLWADCHDFAFQPYFNVLNAWFFATKPNKIYPIKIDIYNFGPGIFVIKAIATLRHFPARRLALCFGEWIKTIASRISRPERLNVNNIIYAYYDHRIGE
jgi:hypothetical protein